jgi:alpha-L-fucosidase
MDIVSKNGNLLINVVQTPEGDLEPDVLEIMENISRWIAVNGEGVYATRPWKVYGEGPSTLKENQKAGRFGGVTDTRGYQPTDVRYTIRQNQLYAFVMDAPEGAIQLKSLGKLSGLDNRKVKSVSLLGSREKLNWKVEDDALVIAKPQTLHPWKVQGFKIVLQ